MKNNSLRLVVLIFLIVMLLALTGCSNENVNKENEEIINNNITDNSLQNDDEIEENTVLQVGNYTLQYGNYVGVESQYDDSGMLTAELTININKDGSYNLTSSNNSLVNSSNGTYNVEKNTYTGINADYILSLSSGSFYIVTDDNTLQVPAGSGAKFVYQGGN